MIASLATLVLAVVATTTPTPTPTQTDKRFSVRQGMRLELNNFAGSIAVQTWNDDVVRVRADHSPSTRVMIDPAGPVIGVSAADRHGVPGTVEYQLTVPKWMSLDLSGVDTDVSVENSEGEVSVETVQGQVTITGGTRIVKANTVDGEVRVTRASGKIEANSVNADVVIERCRGPISASSVNGEVLMSDIDSDEVEASTISGEVRYEGALANGGSYHLTTHSGDLSVVVPENASVTVSVATHAGELTSSFPLKLGESARGGRYTLTLGQGNARMDLESFQGEIRLRRPGEPDTKHGNEYRYEYKYDSKSKHKYDYKYDDSKSQSKDKSRGKSKDKSKDENAEPDEDHEP